MKITRIEIDAFGKFNKFALDLSGGFQIIHGGNEDGKTTLMDFIKLMLYSKAENVRSLQNPRRKYAPFSRRPPAGALIVEHGGVQYVIQKAFGDTPGKDRIRIINLNTGKEEPPRSQEAGQRFTGLDTEGFEQICYIENTGRMNAPAGLNAEEQTIANLTGTGDKRVSRQVILKRLTDAKESLVSKNGKNGSLVDIRAKLQHLRDEKSQTDLIYQKQAALVAEYKSLMELYTEQRALKPITEALSIRDVTLKVEKLLNMIRDRSRDQAALSRPNIPSDRMGEYLERLKQASDEYFDAKRLMEEWSAEEGGYDNLSVISDEDIKHFEALGQRKIALESELSALPGKQSVNIGLPGILHIPIMLLIATSAVAAALYFNSPYYLFILVLLPMVFINIKTGNRKSNIKREAIVKQVAAAQSQAEQILAKYACRNTEQLRERYIAWKAHAKNIEIQSRLEIKISACASRLVAMAELYEPVNTPNNAFMLMEKLTAVMDGMDKINADIHELARELGFSTENPSEISARLAEMKVRMSAALSGQDPESVLNRWNSIKDEDFSQQLLDIQMKLKTPKFTPDQLEIDIEDVSAAASDMAIYYKALESAISVMEESADELRSGFGAELNRRAGSILSDLTNGFYSEILIAKDYSISIKAGSMFREYEYFSSGVIDQAYLALRMALSELTSGQNEPFPLLLDDALMQYDDTRLQAALSRLNKRSGQTVLFTCHRHILEAARPIGTRIASIRDISKIKKQL